MRFDKTIRKYYLKIKQLSILSKCIFIVYLRWPVSPYVVVIVGIPKLLVKDFMASENTPVDVESKRKSGGVPASIISLKWEQTL